jgi:NADPH-dependent 2,4-dienoyl-CoA reductase/sulfur reductase-like enzyme
MFVIGAIRTHYDAPLEQGLLTGDTVRCPWHHAFFRLRTGKALRPLRAPALDPVSRGRVEAAVRDVTRQFIPVDEPVGAVFAREKLEPWKPQPQRPSVGLPKSSRAIPASAGETLPCDRPNLSKAYLAGAPPDASNVLRPAKFCTQHDIELRLGACVPEVDTASRRVHLADGGLHDYDALLLATGAEPLRLDIPSAALPHVRYLRMLAVSRGLVTEALVIGASFIGLEVAAWLRGRNIEVRVVGTETALMEKVLGSGVRDYLRSLHENHGLTFHLGTTATAINDDAVTMKSGENLPADLVVIGMGVWPTISLAQEAGLASNRGVAVDEYLETRAPGIVAAGDIARWPDRLSGEHIRLEHWVVAERQGQVAEHNIPRRRERPDYVPFFWTEQYDFSLAYVDRAERWDEAEIEGSLEVRNCRLGSRELANAFVHRDHDGLRAELEFEQTIAAGEVDSQGTASYSTERR